VIRAQKGERFIKAPTGIPAVEKWSKRKPLPRKSKKTGHGNPSLPAGHLLAMKSQRERLAVFFSSVFFSPLCKRRREPDSHFAASLSSATACQLSAVTSGNVCIPRPLVDIFFSLRLLKLTIL
jgi:hypothetical protein